MDSAVSAPQRHFIGFLTQCFLNHCTHRLQLSISEISKIAMSLEPLDHANLYRKQFGNLEQCLKQGCIPRVFYLDNNLLKVRDAEQLQAAVNEGLITAAQKQALEQKRTEINTLQEQAQRNAFRVK